MDVFVWACVRLYIICRKDPNQTRTAVNRHNEIKNPTSMPELPTNIWLLPIPPLQL